jgi:hypothetical protein
MARLELMVNYVESVVMPKKALGQDVNKLILHPACGGSRLIIH